MHKVVPYDLHVYLDDLLITSATFEEHIQLITEVSARLRSANLTLNVEKSKFCIKEIKYLGYVVGENGLIVDDDKIASISNFPIPRSVKQLRRFIGITGWYRRFISNYSTICAPLTNILK